MDCPCLTKSRLPDDNLRKTQRLLALSEAMRDQGFALSIVAPRAPTATDSTGNPRVEEGVAWIAGDQTIAGKAACFSLHHCRTLVPSLRYIVHRCRGNVTLLVCTGRPFDRSATTIRASAA